MNFRTTIIYISLNKTIKSCKQIIIIRCMPTYKKVVECYLPSHASVRWKSGDRPLRMYSARTSRRAVWLSPRTKPTSFVFLIVKVRRTQDATSPSSRWRLHRFQIAWQYKHRGIGVFCLSRTFLRVTSSL